MLDDKQLKTEILNSIDDKTIPNFSNEIKEKHLKENEKKTPWYKKGLTWAIGTPILATACAILIALPFMVKGNTPSPINPIVPSSYGKNNEIAFGVLSMNNMIPDTSNSIGPKMAIDISENEFSTQMKYLNPYMKTAEDLLNANMDLKPVVNESDDPNYQYKMTIKNADGSELVFYYNEINENDTKNLLKSISPLDDDDDDFDDDLDDDVDDDDEDDEEDGDDDAEQEYQIDGLFKKGEVIYYVYGEKELENNEYELTLNISLIKNDYQNCIRLEQEFENEDNEQEQSYKYSVIKNNKLDFVSELSFEQEDNETSIDVEIFADGHDSEYKISQIDKFSYNISYIYDHQSSKINVNSMIENEENYFKYTEVNLGYVVTLKK